MSKLLTVGANVEYKTVENGKEVTKRGVLHSIRKVDTDSGSRVVSYVVDTGNDIYSDDVKYDVRAVEVTKRVGEELDKRDLTGDERLEAFEEITKDVMAQKDLPKSKIVTETIRQPELVDVIPGNIQPVE